MALPCDMAVPLMCDMAGDPMFQSGQFAVEDVQEFNGYVIHRGKQVSGVLSAGDLVQPLIAQVKTK